MGVFSGMRGWGLPWLVLGLAGAGTGPGAEPPVRIQAEAPVVRTLVSGEVHLYHLALESGDYARLEIVQQGLDVTTVVRGPSGSEVVKVDSPVSRFATETLSLVAEEKGDYQVEVRASKPRNSGRYELILAALRDAGPDDRLRVEAERADLTADQNPEAGRSALERWQTLGDRLREGRALTRLARALEDSGQREDALAFFQKAVALQRELNDREGLAETLGGMGRTLGLLGDDRRALDALRESVALLQEIRQPDRAAATFVNLGNRYQSFGDSSAALAACERGLELSREAADRAQEARALSCLGKVRFQVGQPLEALDDLKKARELAHACGRLTEEAETLSNLGALHQRLGMPREALENYTSAREILRGLGETNREAIALGNLGMFLIELGAFDEARETLNEALPRLQDPRSQAMTLVGLSRIADEFGELPEAASSIEKALALQQAMKDRAGEAESLRAQGLLLLRMGNPAQAEEKLRASLAIHEELGRRGDATARRGLARALAAQGRLDDARQAYEQSRRRAEALGDVASQILTITEQGLLERQAANLPAARERFETALEMMESFRSEVGGNRLRSLHFATVRQTYESYVDVLMQLGLHAQAFEVAEQSRARGLLDVLTRADVDTREGDPKRLEQELRLRQELNAKAALLLELGEDEPARTALRREIDSLATQHRLLEALLTGSAYESLKRPSISLGQIQEMLDGDTVLLEYLLAEPRSYLWVVGKGSLATFELPGRSEIGELARSLHEHLKHTGEREAMSQRQELARLSEKVLGPALGAVSGRRLVIVADGPLQYVPFAALPVRAPDGATVPLVVEHEIGFLPSAAVLKEIRRARAGRPQRPASIAVVADPAYDGEEDRPRKPTELVTRGSGLQRITWSREEAEGIAAVAQGRQLRMALSHDATRELVVSGELEPFTTLHFATHGILDAEHPELSALVLSELDEKGKPLDGYLSLQDLYALRLQADLVVLSGCETGLGRDLRGEGLVGLTHGFLHAGASQVVASLWPVRDHASAALMQRFYQSMLRDGQRPTAALRSAQIEIWEQRKWRDPYFWAAFVAQGDWDASLSAPQACRLTRLTRADTRCLR